MKPINIGFLSSVTCANTLIRRSAFLNCVLETQFIIRVTLKKLSQGTNSYQNNRLKSQCSMYGQTINY